MQERSPAVLSNLKLSRLKLVQFLDGDLGECPGAAGDLGSSLSQYRLMMGSITICICAGVEMQRGFTSVVQRSTVVEQTSRSALSFSFYKISCLVLNRNRDSPSTPDTGPAHRGQR